MDDAGGSLTVDLHAPKAASGKPHSLPPAAAGTGKASEQGKPEVPRSP